jgi:linker histone H1 and H5 family
MHAYQECIAAAGDRTGVSRPTIKKYIEEKYKMEVTASVISNINRSIAYGADKGTFVLPKGALTHPYRCCISDRAC